MSNMAALDVAAQTVDPGQTALVWANNLRIAAMAIAAYDYLITLPVEIRLYKTSSRRSPVLILFVLIRYSSMIEIVVSNIGFFYHDFSPSVCAHYCYVSASFKVIQVMVSQAILGFRTYNIAMRNVWIGNILLSIYIIAVMFQWYTDLANRIPVTTNGNCMIESAHPDQPISAWTFYFTTMLYDFIALSIATVYLLKPNPAQAMFLRGVASILAPYSAARILNTWLYDGLGYFVALTAVNLMNLFLYRVAAPAVQTSGASFGYAITWIMSQRILTHLFNERMKLASAIELQQPTTTTTTTTVPTPRFNGYEV
ncbi:hypothetical protein BC827DRAFT_901432 [Russula dissimulans]|nr:hypothetical protein BC827DRAFT_901432 [Russula dissimulans]